MGAILTLYMSIGDYTDEVHLLDELSTPLGWYDWEKLSSLQSVKFGELWGPFGKDCEDVNISGNDELPRELRVVRASDYLAVELIHDDPHTWIKKSRIRAYLQECPPDTIIVLWLGV